MYSHWWLLLPTLHEDRGQWQRTHWTFQILWKFKLHRPKLNSVDSLRRRRCLHSNELHLLHNSNRNSSELPYRSHCGSGWRCCDLHGLAVAVQLVDSIALLRGAVSQGQGHVMPKGMTHATLQWDPRYQFTLGHHRWKVPLQIWNLSTFSDWHWKQFLRKPYRFFLVFAIFTNWYVLRIYPQVLRVWNGSPPGVCRSRVWNGTSTIVDLWPPTIVDLCHVTPLFCWDPKSKIPKSNNIITKSSNSKIQHSKIQKSKITNPKSLEDFLIGSLDVVGVWCCRGIQYPRATMINTQIPKSKIKNPQFGICRGLNLQGDSKIWLPGSEGHEWLWRAERRLGNATLPIRKWKARVTLKSRAQIRQCYTATKNGENYSPDTVCQWKKGAICCIKDFYILIAPLWASHSGGSSLQRQPILEYSNSYHMQSIFSSEGGKQTLVVVWCQFC